MTSPATSADHHSAPEPAPSDAPKTPRSRFGKIEKLCSKRSFDILFEARQAFYCGSIQVIYHLDHPSELASAPVMVAITAPKRSFKRAVDRNLLKRRIREAYRTRKAPLIAKATQKGKNVAFLIKYNVREIRNFNVIAQDVQKAIDRLMKLL